MSTIKERAAKHDELMKHLKHQHVRAISRNDLRRIAISGKQLDIEKATATLPKVRERGAR